MLLIEINQENLEVDPSQYSTFRELVHAIESKHLDPKGEVITAIFLNGAELEEQEEADQAQLPIDRVRSLKMRTSNKEELALQALRDAVQILPEISKVLNSCLQHFEDSANVKGMHDFVTIADGLNWFSSVYHGTETIFRDKIKSSGLGSSQFLEASRRLSRLVQELLHSQQRSDMTTFRDILEYELGPLLKDIIAGLPSFLEGLSANQNLEFSAAE